jgi:hypothetical protein
VRQRKRERARARERVESLPAAPPTLAKASISFCAAACTCCR